MLPFSCGRHDNYCHPPCCSGLSHRLPPAPRPAISPAPPPRPHVCEDSAAALVLPGSRDTRLKEARWGERCSPSGLSCVTSLLPLLLVPFSTSDPQLSCRQMRTLLSLLTGCCWDCPVLDPMPGCQETSGDSHCSGRLEDKLCRAPQRSGRGWVVSRGLDQIISRGSSKAQECWGSVGCSWSRAVNHG